MYQVSMEASRKTQKALSLEIKNDRSDTENAAGGWHGQSSALRLFFAAICHCDRLTAAVVMIPS